MAMVRYLPVLCFSIALHLAYPPIVLAQIQGRGSPLSPVSILSGTNPEKESAGGKKDEPQTAVPSYPGLAEVIPKSSELAREAMALRERIGSIRNTTAIEKKIDQAESQRAKLAKQIGVMGDPGAWDFNRLTDVRVILQGERKDYDGLLLQVSTPLNELEALRKDWETKQEHWQEWKKQLETSSQAELPQDAFKKVSETIRGVLQELSQASGELIALQERVRNLVEAGLALGKPIDAALAKLRSDTFKKVEPNILSSEYFAQFDSSLWQTLRKNVVQSARTETSMFLGYSWILLLRIGVIFLVGMSIRRIRSPELEDGRWKFVVSHPWASGILISHLVEIMVSEGGASSLRLISQALLVFSCCILAPQLVSDRRKRNALFALGFILVLSNVFKTIAFSTPFYRLYLSGVSLTALAVIVFWARSRSRAAPGKIDSLSLMLLLGGIAFTVSFLSVLLGFGNLAELVFFASIWTVFIGVGIFLVYELSVFGMEVTLSRPLVARLRFFNRYGQEFARRLKIFLKATCGGFVVLTLSQAWGGLPSPAQAWEKVFESQVHLGGISLSLGLIVLSFFALYLAGSISWFLRAFLEAEVFPRNQVDRGAGDAIKKLLHYFLMLIGFLIGVGILGIDVKNFFVLGGALGIGIGFGLQNIVNNFISGLILLFERPIKVGDMVVVENESGRVRKIGLRSTVIETFDRAELIVPNSQFISQKVTNWTFSNPLARIKIPIGAAYGTDIPLVLGLLKEAALRNPKVLSTPQPLPLFVRFGESSLDFELHVWIADVADRLVVQSEIGQAIASSFREAVVEIPFPQREVTVRTPKE